jgi:hypothetical protein
MAHLCIVIMTAAVVSVSGPARAMTIVQFDKMAVADQGEYIGDLVQGTEKVLTEIGKPDLAKKVELLFTTQDAGSRLSITIGAGEFEIALARARLVDAQNVTSDPKAGRLEVEDAMLAVMEKNGIALRDSFFTVNANFRPKLPPRQ